jgi:hypothetical protein
MSVMAGFVAVAAGLQLWWVVTVPATASFRTVGLLTGLAAALLAGAALRQPFRQWRTASLAVVWLPLAVLFVWQVVHTPPPYPDRLLHVAVAIVHAAVALLIAGRTIGWPPPGEAALLLGSIAVALLAVEAWLEPDPDASAPVVRWEGSLLPDSVLGERYAPYSEMRTWFVDNPRDYFEAVDPRAATWRLATHRGVAQLEVHAADEVELAVRIDTVGVPDRSAVQVNQAGLEIRAGARYRLRFLARAVPSRTISYAVSRAHPPWDGVGLYRDLVVDSTWRETVDTFRASGATDNARVHFDLGGPPGGFRARGVELVNLDSAAVVAPPLDSTGYVVRYRFNGLGCRGPDRAIPAAPGTVRIVGLGDSYLLGVGVHEADVLTAHLERLLNERATRRRESHRYEVINCGVSGYATKQERLFYESVARTYRPDIVLLAYVSNDDISWLDEVQQGWIGAPGPLAQLFMTWGLIEHRVRDRPPPDFGPVLDETLRLAEAVRGDGGRLFTFLFRNEVIDTVGGGARWGALRQAVAGGLAARGIPFHDAGADLLAAHSFAELRVHPADGHPNELAHRLTAEVVARMLEEAGVLGAPD